MKLEKQIKYCKEKNLPMFVSEDGQCWNCHKIISDTDDKLITGCPYCNISFCD